MQLINKNLINNKCRTFKLAYSIFICNKKLPRFLKKKQGNFISVYYLKSYFKILETTPAPTV